MFLYLKTSIKINHENLCIKCLFNFFFTENLIVFIVNGKIELCNIFRFLQIDKN